LFIYVPDLSWGCRLQTQAPSGGLKFVWRGHAFLVERESLVFVQEFFAFSAEVFALVTELHGSEVLLGREHETTGQDQSTEQQQREPRQGGDVARAPDFRVWLKLWEAFHRSGYPLHLCFEFTSSSQLGTARARILVNFTAAGRNRPPCQNFNYFPRAARTNRQTRWTFAMTRQASQFPFEDSILE